MEHEDDEFHTPFSSDAKESVDCIHLDSDSETFEVLDQNEKKGEFTSKVGDISLGMTFDNEEDAYGKGLDLATPKKKGEETRCGCKAMLEIKLNLERKFVVTNFVAEHSHVLVPASSSHLLRSQRIIEPSQAKLINQMHSARLQPSQIFSYFTTEAGGSQKLNFIQSDCNNLIMRKRIGILKKGNSECFFFFFFFFFFWKKRCEIYYQQTTKYKSPKTNTAQTKYPSFLASANQRPLSPLSIHLPETKKKCCEERRLQIEKEEAARRDGANSEWDWKKMEK
ncbi:hypothetical protein D8674_019922 [Pyrus ussuriensis x Pyrus communis]|uniref:FAR1 domain-containing protein n=1 Tax=Pyrus ussuriensis x Pyrus communis TaxID=2448454 RepID=A0A5N5GEJ3_9ROSA|nr:hypothetical protein D8674_019922 [Pyrus ussuriensis x Pyrus communis]